MNRLYYVFMYIFMASLFACEEGGPEVVNMQNQEPVVSVLSIAPDRGYVGDRVTITGTEFGSSKTFTKAFFGDFEAEVISCSEVKLVVSVPEEAVSGEIFIEIMGKKMATGQEFVVLDDPSFPKVEPLSGYAGSEVTFVGTGMPKTADNLVVKFNEIPVEIKDYSVDEVGNGSMKVMVPQDELKAGNVELTIWMHGRRISKKNFSLVASPELETVNNRLVIAGRETVIKGTGLHDFIGKIVVYFDGTAVRPDNDKVSANGIKIEVPTDFAGGQVVVELEGYGNMELGNWIVMAAGGDITETVLKNSLPPFVPMTGYTGGEWANPEGWTLDNFNGNALSFPEDVPDGLLTIQSGGGQANKQDAKLYQVVTLPAGTYQFVLDIYDCKAENGGRFGAWFVITEGNGTIPGLSDQIPGPNKYTWWFVDETPVLASYRISDRPEPHQQTIDLVLDKDSEITIGFVTQFTNIKYLKVASIRVNLK